MFGIFKKKKSEIDKLYDKHKKLLEEAHRLSHTDRLASDMKTAEAMDVIKEIEAIEKRQQ